MPLTFAGQAAVFERLPMHLRLPLRLGSFAAALLAGEFKVRVPRQPVRFVQSLGGGVIMGYGAGLGLGWIRGGTHKVRTSPRAFQGHGLEGGVGRPLR